ncbi:MAG: 2-phospho-L-lactate guanylyltransferase [Nocardioides sp.]|nr:2-phospho-L-lactate guanylyltransferase [Nocardioides sp.]
MARWCAVVPQKALASAKSRTGLADAQRRELATALLRDTVAALEETPAVDAVLVLWDDELDRVVLPDVRSVRVAGLGLNASLERGAAVALDRLPGRGIVVVPGDLPALDPAELGHCLAEAARFRRAFLPDREGTGTTVLTAGGGDLRPAYGAGSASRHAATGAVPLDVAGVDTVRADVDDLDSLAAVLGGRCGRHTRAAAARLGPALEAVG